MSYDWREHWKSDHHPFHVNQVNPLLEQYWSCLQLPTTSRILVPLCGKTTDLLWLASLGHQVIGVEISPIACEAFFVENNLPFECYQEETVLCYSSANIKIYCEDFFKLNRPLLPDLAAIYDRAALIALPPDVRQSYVEQCDKLTAKNADILLIVMDTQDLTHEHPYPISVEDVKALFADHFIVNELARIKIKNPSSFLVSRGYREAYEVVYQLKKIF